MTRMLNPHMQALLGAPQVRVGAGTMMAPPNGGPMGMPHNPFDTGYGSPGGALPGTCPPYYPPACNPCPPDPNQQAMAQAAYNDWCARQAAGLRRAAAAEIMAKSPQLNLPIGNDIDAETGLLETVASGAVVTFETSPEVDLCLTRFVVDTGAAPFFLILEMKSAMETFIANSGPGTPATAFAEDAISPPLDLPLLRCGCKMILTVRNRDAAPRAFVATYWGIRASRSQSCLPGYAG